MRRNLVLLIPAVCMFFTMQGYGNLINWGTEGQQLYGPDGTTFLPGNSQRDETSTGFIQLLYLGEDGIYDGIIPEGDGTLGDDVVIDQSWVGQGNIFLNPAEPGRFTGQDPLPPSAPYTSEQSSFAIRVFDTAVSDADWEAGNIPTSGFYNYIVFENPVKTADFYDLWITSPLTVGYEIPEPSAALLFGLALVWLSFGRRRRPV